MVVQGREISVYTVSVLCEPQRRVKDTKSLSLDALMSTLARRRECLLSLDSSQSVPGTSFRPGQTTQ